ncbi:hypothetical protein OROGR_012223 [Orobanche gracilis]
MSRLIFLHPLALALCLTFQTNHVIATDGAIEKATTNALIGMACAATTSPRLCSATLRSIANNPYANPSDIAITAVQAATKTAVATFDLINMSLTIKIHLLSDPQLRQSLVVCAKEYRNILDYMDKASTSLTQKVDTPQVPEYLNSAIGCIAKCDATGIKFTNKAVQVTAKNVDTKKLIKNALAIYEVFADYITNPSHDPSKASVSMPDTPKADGSKTLSSADGGDDSTVKGTTSGGGYGTTDEKNEM